MSLSSRSSFDSIDFDSRWQSDEELCTEHTSLAPSRSESPLPGCNLEPIWQPTSQKLETSMPSLQKTFILSSSSMTNLLYELVGGKENFGITVLNQGMNDIRSYEENILCKAASTDTRIEEQCWAREVFLQSVTQMPAPGPVMDGAKTTETRRTNLIYARSVFWPYGAQDREAAVVMASLGTRSLGEILLFSKPPFSRGTLEICEDFPHALLPDDILVEDGNLPKKLWARQSVFTRGCVYVLVMEVFLEGMWQAAETQEHPKINSISPC